MFQYSFMQNALMAILLASVMGGTMGYFILMRRLAFAAHGLGHISFTGAALALLLQINPLWGQFLATLSAGFFMGLLGDTLQKRDVTIAVILALMLGLGMLFLHFYTGSTNVATSLLFGDVLGVSRDNLCWMAWMTVVNFLVLSLIARPLIFMSLSSQLAEAKQVPQKTLNVIFLLLVATAVTLVNQIVGALLVFVLLVGPAAISLNLTRSFWPGLSLSIVIAVVLGVLSLMIAFYADLPVSVCLTGLVCCGYFMSLLKKN